MGNYPLSQQANGEKLRGVVAFGTESVAVAAVIANGQSLSDAARLDSAIPVRLVIPAGFLGNGIEVQTSIDGTDFFDLYGSDGSKVRLTAVAGSSMRLTPAEWIGIKAVKFRAVLNGVAQAQDAARAISIVAVP